MVVVIDQLVLKVPLVWPDYLLNLFERKQNAKCVFVHRNRNKPMVDVVLVLVVLVMDALVMLDVDGGAKKPPRPVLLVVDVIAVVVVVVATGRVGILV